MSSLYRCKARVGYRPAKSDKLIVFPEKQIQELSVKLKWEPNAGSGNADKSSPATAYTSGLGQSTCSVTISDPYLTGLAWPALLDAAALYTQSNISTGNDILLPPCEEGQDPNTDKCAKYVDIESDNTTDQAGLYPLLLLSLWYEVKGTSFGTDFYFRVSGFSVSHGARYPSVTIRGVEARSVLFNQSLVNLVVDEGVEVDKALKDLVEKQGYQASFCANTNSDPSKKRLLPRSVRYTGVTLDEVIKKVLNSVNGNSLSMPTRDWANKISLCSRGEVSQGCSVFYLGKGLYEGYEINGQPELTAVALNTEFGDNANNANPYTSESFKANTYTIGNMVPKKRKKAMEAVKKLEFPEIFKPASKHIKPSVGYVWQGAGPVVINEEATKVEKSGLGLFGRAPNGTTAISFLTGEVAEADNKEGRVNIKTKFSLQVCEKEGSQKCFFRPIYQESTGLSSVKVKAKDKVKISQEIGTSTSDKPEFTRFYILGHNSALTILDPKLVWEWAFPEEDIPKQQAPAVSSTPADKIVSPAPKKQLQDWQPTTTTKPKKVLLMAGHFDARRTGAPNEWELNAELVKWAQRNAQAYGVSDFIEVYFPPGEVAASSAQSQYSKTAAAVTAGKQVIEIHLDGAQGSSGVIPPRKGGIGQINGALASSYGAFSKDHRDGLGVPNRGGTILEVGRMDGATTQTFLKGSSAQKEALYKQLMDPVMRSIASEKTRGAGESGSPPSPSGTTSGATSGGSSEVAVGRIGNTGSSEGAHLHAQWEDGRAISEAEVRKYVKFGSSVVVTSPYNDPSRSGHKGIDLAAGGDSTGVPLSIQGGAGVVNAQKGCKVGDVKCGGGFGNNVLISTPEGNMILAHLQEDSIPPNIAGLTTSSGGGKSKPTIQGSPVTNGLTVETGFKGIPRALRIIPGRTILSFISDYDIWVEEGHPASIDPGVWIAERFKNWFITECSYRWRDGDLRVDLSAVSAWGSTRVSSPTFTNYIAGVKKFGDAKITNTYYDYIRSIGELNWKTEDGKDSTEVYCSEAQALSAGQASGSDSTNPTSTQGSFPSANCKTGDATKDAIINALYSAGLKTPNAFAGALGNIQEESQFNPNIHNTPIQGFTCLADSGASEKCYGLVQWGGSRKVAALKKCGQTSTLQCQLEFVVQEIKQRGGGLVEGMNLAGSASAAAEIWRRKYEVASGGIAKRQQFAEQIVKQIKCG